MVRKLLCCLTLCLLVNSTCGDSFADEKLNNWHQWRGPESNGTAPLGTPPVQWGPEQNIKWKVAIPGRGHSTPIIWGDRIFLLTAIRTDREVEQPAEEAEAAVTGPPVRQVAYTTTEATDSTPPPLLAQAEERPEGDRPRRGRGGRGGGRGFGFGGGGPPTHVHQFVVLCLDRNTGEKIWEQIACEAVPHEGHHQTGSFASASPVTDGKHLYVSFGSRGIYKYDLDGNMVWPAAVDLGKMRTRFAFGEGSSPALHGNRLVVNWDHEDQSFIVALDTETGEEVWRQNRDEASSWNTPLVVEHDGRTQVIVNGQNRARSYDLETGELIWECGGQMANPIPSPVTYDGLAICMTGFRGYAAYAIPLDSTGDITGTDEIAWQVDEGTPYVSSPVLYGDRLYFTRDRAGIMSCVHARTGDVIIDRRRVSGLEDIYASPVAADGRVYFIGRNGNVVVIDATTDAVEILATNELGETFDASPAIVAGELYLRGENHLFCIAEP